MDSINLYSNQHNQQLFKIIELPPELLAALESASPPSLSITSAPNDVSSMTHRGLKPRTALITHGSIKYSMRSKSTSNPILLLKPLQTSLEMSRQALHHELEPSLTAIAQCEETIELVPWDESPQVEEKKTNKWHEKFAKSRGKQIS